MRDNPLPVILILLILAVLIYYFYQSTSGDLDAAIRSITNPGGSGGNPIELGHGWSLQPGEGYWRRFFRNAAVSGRLNTTYC